MGLRFRKSITLVPGLAKLNFSKTGVSLSLGSKGKTVNVGTGGVYGNVSLGNGVSYRKKLTDLLPKGAGSTAFKRRLKTVMTVVVILYVVFRYVWPFIGNMIAATAK